jgi:low molecular weight protein-tyrosine phosphatase
LPWYIHWLLRRPRSAVRELLSRLRRVPERVLHRLRRRRVVDAVRRRRRVASLLVICHGNICRSPFAAAVLRSALSGNGVRVDSAGFIGPGRPSPPEALAAAARYGVDLSGHRSQALTADSVRAADLIIVMDTAQRREICDRFGCVPRDVVVLGDLDPQAIDARTIRDPVNQPLAVFEEAYARIERCARELVRAIG